MSSQGQNFTPGTITSARKRQRRRCGHCGRSLSSLWEEAHHLKPRALGGRNEVNNCVIVCDTCHWRVHKDGNYRSLVVAPRSYYPYFNGKK